MSNYNRTGQELHYSAVFQVYNPATSFPLLDITFLGISITSFNTSVTPQWSPEKAGGRADPLYRYEQFSREVNLSFDLIAYNPKDHDENYRNLNRLAASTMPVYDKSGNNGNGYSGCLVKVQIGAFSAPLIRAYAIITNLSYSWDDRYPWKLAEPTVDGPALSPNYLRPTVQSAPAGTSVTLALTMLGKDNHTRYAFKDTEKSNNLFNLQKFE